MLNSSYKDRHQAGKIMAKALDSYRNSKHVIILALPRGGVPVAYEVAKKLNLPLTVFVSRKIGAPTSPEFGIGAIAEENTIVLDAESIDYLKLSKEDIESYIIKEKEELDRRVQKYRKNESLNLKGKTVILIDDGLATGVTAKAAIKGLRKLIPSKIIFASPVCAKDTISMIEDLADEVICILSPIYMTAIGQYYKNFNQVSDNDVMKLLQKAKKKPKQSQVQQSLA